MRYHWTRKKKMKKCERCGKIVQKTLSIAEEEWCLDCVKETGRLEAKA